MHEFFGRGGYGLDVRRRLRRRVRGGCNLLRRLRDGVRHPAEVDVYGLLQGRFFLDLTRDVGAEFHNLERPTRRIEYRVIGCLQPKILAVLPDPAELSRTEFSPLQTFPEFAIGLTFAFGLRHEDAMVPPFYFIERVADGVQEVFVGSQDCAIQREMDRGIRLVDGGDLAFELRRCELPGRYVGAEFHDLVRLAVLVEQRIIGCLDPDLAVVVSDTFVFGDLELPSLEPRPKLGIGRAVAFFLGDKDLVVPTLDLGERVADRAQKVVVCRNDCAVELELDHGLRSVQCVQLGL